jgi:hypothetical protein
MTTLLTTQEIKNHYKSEWVLLESPETTATFEIVRGRVVFHSKDRDEVYRKLLEINPDSSAILYTGKLPQDTAIIL